MKLFNDQTTSNFIKEQENDIINTIKDLSDDEIMTRDLNELKNYFYDKFYIEPITVFKDNITSQIAKSQKEEHNPLYSMNISIYEEESYYFVDSYKITYSIPFSGRIALLYLKPSMSILSRFEIDRIENSNPDCYPCIICSININQKKLESKDDPNAFLDAEFKREYNKHFDMIGNVNNDISKYNNRLESFILKQLEERKSKADNLSVLLKKLNIPLKENPNAPQLQVLPLTLKKISKSFPKEKITEKNWEISDEDYLHIKIIISNASSSFERAPSAYQKLSEEELRDILLANLNTHYNSLATGETFSKKGKTDIRIQFENKAAFIGECKLWHGISEFEKAIKQLISYTTWRDVKTSLIVFNKNNKDFNSIIRKVEEFIKDNSLFVNSKCISKNEWQCTIRRDENSSELLQLHIILCDITL